MSFLFLIDWDIITGSTVLREAKIPVLTNTECEIRYGGHPRLGILPEHICVGDRFHFLNACHVSKQPSHPNPPKI